jgi:hypothetical protein
MGLATKVAKKKGEFAKGLTMEVGGGYEGKKEEMGFLAAKSSKGK